MYEKNLALFFQDNHKMILTSRSLFLVSCFFSDGDEDLGLTTVVGFRSDWYPDPKIRAKAMWDIFTFCNLFFVRDSHF